MAAVGAHAVGQPSGTVRQAEPLLVSRRFALLCGRRRVLLAKRVMDIGIGTMALLALSPLLLVIATLIKLESPGPVFYRQLRYGRNNRSFWLIKFRSMRTEACHAWGRSLEQTGRNDPRVTRLGRLLRSSSLDELPQLFNILKGDMGLVGPRPHAVDMTVLGVGYHEMFPAYWMRHLVRPGLTGLAQAAGNRGIVDTREKAADRLALDLAYVDGVSLRGDLLILLRTVRVFLRDPMAF